MRKAINTCGILCTALFLVVAMSVTVYAQTQSGAYLGHDNDKFEFGSKYSVTLKQGQYSKFYCKDKKHSATARVGVEKDGKTVYYSSKKTANKKCWAKAETSLYGNVVEWNSYYSHID